MKNNEGNDVGVDDTYGEYLVKYAVKNFHAYFLGKASPSTDILCRASKNIVVNPFVW